jgi:hypothetical protein
MSKKKIYDFSKTFEEVREIYFKNQKQYNEIWGKKRKLLFILWIFIIPGIIYSLIYFSSANKFARNKLANEVLVAAANSISTSTPDSFLNSVKLNYYPTNKFSVSPFYLGIASDQYASASKKFKTGQYSFSDNSKSMVGMLSRSQVAPYLIGTKKSFWTFFAKIGFLVYRRITISHNLSISFKIGEVEYSGTNLKVNNFELRRIPFFFYSGKNSKKAIVLYVYKWTSRNSFNGIFLTSNTTLDYKGDILIKERKFHTIRDIWLSHPFKKLKYQLGSETFTKVFDVKVNTEDGVGLRKLFQPRIMMNLNDVGEYIPPFVMTSLASSNSTSIAVESSKGSGFDRGLFIDSPSKFFKNKDFGYKLLSKELNKLVAICKILSNFNDNEKIIK